MADGARLESSAPAPKNPSRRVVRLGVDIPLLLVSFSLVVFGILMVYSASWDFSLAIYHSPTHIFIRQMWWLGLGVGLALILTFIDYHKLKKVALPIMLFTIMALAGVLVIGEVRFGAARALSQGSYQPSELAKLVIVIYLSVWLYSKREYLSNIFWGLIPLGVILGLVGGLILLQPDFSAVLTIMLLGGIMFFLAGGELRQIILLIFLTLVVGYFVVKISSTGNDRVTSYLNGLRDPTKASYHVRRSLEAFVKGGWFGVGIGKANTKLTGLPVPPTDSIYAVVGEETGVIGASLLVLCYAVFFWRGLVIASQAPDLLGLLLAGGLSFWIAMEAFINMAVIVGLLPFAGNALPFISSGGSNLIVSLIAVGIMLNVSRTTKLYARVAGRGFVPAVDFHNRNQRRRNRVARKAF